MIYEKVCQLYFAIKTENTMILMSKFHYLSVFHAPQSLGAEISAIEIFPKIESICFTFFKPKKSKCAHVHRPEYAYKRNFSRKKNDKFQNRRKSFGKWNF